MPCPLTLFSLKPLNPRAHDIVAHPSNNYLHSTLPDGTTALDVGFNIRPLLSNTLATLGRNDTDIIVEGSSIGRVQCSFEIDLDSRVVMLYDRSNGQTTQVSGANVTPFKDERPRRVVVQKGLNTIIGMGGVGCDLVQFELIWHQDPIDTVEKVKTRDAITCGVTENPRLARIVDEAPAILLSREVTGIDTPRERKLRVRYAKIGQLGSGQFGTVYKCVDVDTGKFMAVKILQQHTKASNEAEWRQSLHCTLKREVDILSEVNHPNIVDYITCQGWNEPQVEIFMGLKDGTLKSLIESGSCERGAVADSVFPQMLRALDCLASNDIIHRDVKPENILYLSQPGSGYQFQLGDFGLCNRVIDAKTFAGSRLYMVPEMFLNGKQTHKVDVWSLFVTMLWTLDIEEFRQRSQHFKSDREVQQAVSTAASTVDRLSEIREMASENPENRASAGQMLLKHYDEVKLSTPHNSV